MNDSADIETNNAIARARLISAALPYMLAYDGKVVVVKYGGHAMGDPELAKAFARDITLLETSGAKPVVVHGGGPQIGDMLRRLGIESEFRDGLRVTDKPTVEVVEMVLAGSINKEIVMAINAEGGKAVGLCGKDGNMVFAEKVSRTIKDPDSNIEKVIDLGFVGEPTRVNRAVVDMVLGAELIPVIAPVAPGLDGNTYNVNADTFAGAIAGALGATRLLFLTDVPGVLDRHGRLVREMTAAGARAMIADGTITGGMIPKVETCIEALGRGVAGVVILNGRTPHAVLLELFTDHGAGTLIKP
jgi:acetylglutamate kinase